jgi:hypothetical protein
MADDLFDVFDVDSTSNIENNIDSDAIKSERYF